MSSMLQLESAGRVLKVTEAALEDSGKYTCLATNAAGEAQQHIRLSVHGNDAQSFRLLLIISAKLFAYVLSVPQSLPASLTPGTSTTRPSCQVFPLSLNA